MLPYLWPSSLVYSFTALFLYAPEKGVEAHAALFRLMICSAAGNAIPPGAWPSGLAELLLAGVPPVAAGVRVTVPTQVTLVLLHDAVGSVLRCLAPCLSLRKTSGGETRCCLPLCRGTVFSAA